MCCYYRKEVSNAVREALRRSGGQLILPKFYTVRQPTRVELLLSEHFPPKKYVLSAPYRYTVIYSPGVVESDAPPRRIWREDATINQGFHLPWGVMAVKKMRIELKCIVSSFLTPVPVICREDDFIGAGSLGLDENADEEDAKWTCVWSRVEISPKEWRKAIGRAIRYYSNVRRAAREK